MSLAASAPPVSGNAEPPADFTVEARALFRMAACGAIGEVPPRFDSAVVARHCEELRHIYEEYRRTFVEPATAFFAAHRPHDVPSRVVYPFGGGDLATALATFPDASEITTLSLEPAGDARLVDSLPAHDLRRDLALHRAHVERLYDWGYSRTENLGRAADARLPGELLFALAALVVHGDEPVSLRYFRLHADGSLAYVTASDLAPTREGVPPPRALFENAELRFRAAGAGGTPVRVFRHVAANLDDDHLRAAPWLLAYLDAQRDRDGHVAAMTKAASHLLWTERFSLLASWLLRHVSWMASDSTGFPPRLAGAAGLTQEPFGIYDGRPWGMREGQDGADLRALFALDGSAPRALGFHYGYPDKDGHAYVILTHR
ncbi:MAG: hypothetical protein JOZ69_10085 [Myxococcales bacterium]|nr:hypothetical protein [Myxococcales bacterium]